MIRISIGGNEKPLEDATPSWIRDQIEDRRHNRSSVCVRVTIHSGSLNMVLSTPACAAAGGGSGGTRPPSPSEQEIFDLWEKRGMNSDSFNVGQLTAFLSEIKSRV
jgi:hypothetical protein